MNAPSGWSIVASVVRAGGRVVRKLPTRRGRPHQHPRRPLGKHAVLPPSEASDGRCIDRHVAHPRRRSAKPPLPPEVAGPPSRPSPSRWSVAPPAPPALVVEPVVPVELLAGRGAARRPSRRGSARHSEPARRRLDRACRQTGGRDRRHPSKKISPMPTRIASSTKVRSNPSS